MLNTISSSLDIASSSTRLRPLSMITSRLSLNVCTIDLFFSIVIHILEQLHRRNFLFVTLNFVSSHLTASLQTFFMWKAYISHERNTQFISEYNGFIIVHKAPIYIDFFLHLYRFTNEENCSKFWKLLCMIVANKSNLLNKVRCVYLHHTLLVIPCNM